MFGNLKFDKMVDTAKAKEYMKSYTVFKSFCDSNEYEIDICGNKIMYSDYLTLRLIDNSKIPKVFPAVTPGLPDKLNNLANLVEKNKLLFAQIEYMLRKKPIDESLNMDLKLIVQNILYVKSMNVTKKYTSNALEMRGGSPLAALGFVAQLLFGSSNVVVEATPSVAVLCHLFVELCCQAGLPVKLAIVNEKSSFGTVCHLTKELESAMQRGCACAVAERADVEAAVDTVIASATQDPWRVRRVLVQESAIERFERALEWKSRRNHSDDGTTVAQCSKAYRIGDKLFLFEHTGLEQVEGQVTVEAYRTVKELLSLLDVYKPFAASLWCADVAQANEIAYGIDSNVVWINDYGSFYGPLKSSQAFYSLYDVSYATKRVHFDVKSLFSRRDSWMKLDAKLRYQLLINALVKARFASPFQNLDLNKLEDNFVEVTDNGICVGLERQCPVVLFENFNNYIDIAICLMQGHAVVFLKSSQEFSSRELDVLLNELETTGAPLVYKDIGETGECQVTLSHSRYRVKVVRTNFGTIFAN